MKLINTLLAALTAVTSVSAGNIYVSPAGSDTATGSAAEPLRTVGEALKRAREWRRLGDAGAEGNINIILADGIYTLTRPLFVRPEDSGRNGSVTTVCAAPGASPVISGGVDITGWSRGTDDKRVPARLRDSIWVAPAPHVGNRMVESRQLYVDGVKATRAAQFAPGVMQRMVDFDPENMTITVPAPGIDLTDAAQGGGHRVQSPAKCDR